MSIWSTKSSGRDIEYIVLKHTLRGVNYVINGIRFRDSYAVVQKDSKTHRNLKSVSVLRGAKEYPLIILRDLKFITRALDVRNVYGADVYYQYLKQLNKVVEKEVIEEKIQEEIKHVEVNKLCAHTIYRDGENRLCKEEALEHSPSGFCLKHILEEPKLAELGIEVSRFIPKKDKYAMKDKVSDQLKKLKKDGKF